MAVTKTINIIVKDGDLDRFEKNLNEAGLELDKVDNKVKKVGKTSKDEFGGSQEAASRLSGGVQGIGEQFVVVAKSAKKGGQAMRSALISTGVGALIVALGIIIDNWEEIAEWLGIINKDLENQRRLLEINAKLLDAQIDNIREEQGLRKAQGLSIDELIAKEEKLLKARIENRKEVLKTRQEELKLAVQRFNEITTGEQILQFFGKDARTQEDLDKINELRELATEASTELLKAQKALQDLQNEEFDRNAIVVGGEQKNKGKSGVAKRDKITGIGLPLTAEEQQAALDEKSRQFEQIFELEKMQEEALANLKKNSLDDVTNSEFLALQKRQRAQEKFRQQQIVEEKILTAQKIALTQDTLGKLVDILGENSAAGKAAAIAQATINTFLGVTEVLANKTVLPEPFGTINKIASVAGVLITGFKAVKDITSTKLPSFASGGEGGGAPSGGGAPAFNVVGASGTNQLAETLSQGQQPIQTYVVASDVTTQQELDNNIVQTASIG